jgi:DNA-binding LytR/AlgR family response regulator
MSEHISDTSDMGLRRTTSEHIGKGKAPRDGPVMLHALLPRLAIRIKGRTRFVSTDCVLVVLAQGNYVLLECESASYPLRESITAIQKQLEPYGFVRIHRSVLVNRLWVEEIRPYLTGDYRLRIRGGKEFKVTRTYKCNLKSLAELWLSNDSFLER